jgi:hypothetical protein
MRFEFDVKACLLLAVYLVCIICFGAILQGIDNMGGSMYMGGAM